MGREENVRLIFDRIVKNDDEHAFRDFFNLYYNRLLNFAHYFLESSVAAEEVVSEVFVKVWKYRKKLSEVKHIDAYLFTSTKHGSLNYLRDNKRLNEFKDLADEESFLILEFENPESIFLDRELQKKIIGIIEDLPPRCKMIFTLIREDGLKYKEVAEIMEISVKTVEVQMGRALSKIRASLEKYLNYDDIADLINR